MTTLDVPAFNMPLSCAREGCQTVYGAWQGTASNPIASAEYRAVLEGYLCLDGKGC